MEVNRDAIADFRPLNEFRAKMMAAESSTSSPAIVEAAERWLELADTFLLAPEIDIPELLAELGYGPYVVPFGFEELTFVLAWWCDCGPLSIDPTPLTECLRHAQNASACHHTPAYREEGITELIAFRVALLPARDVIRRMRYAAIVAMGAEPDEPESNLSEFTRRVRELYDQGVTKPALILDQLGGSNGAGREQMLVRIRQAKHRYEAELAAKNRDI